MTLKIVGRITSPKRTAGAFCGAACEVTLVEVFHRDSPKVLARQSHAAVLRESDGMLIEYCDNLDAAHSRACALSLSPRLARDAAHSLRRGRSLCQFEGLHAVRIGASDRDCDSRCVRLWQSGQSWHMVFDSERGLGAFMADISRLLAVTAV